MCTKHPAPTSRTSSPSVSWASPRTRLVQIWETHPALPQLQVTVPDFQDWRDQARSFEQIAAYTLSAMNTATLLGQGEPEIVHATMASVGAGYLKSIVASREFSSTTPWLAVFSRIGTPSANCRPGAPRR